MPARVFPYVLLAAAALGGCRCGTDAAPDAGRPPSVGNPRALLDPTTLPQFVSPLVVPALARPISRTAEMTEYRIAARLVEQQILPDGMPRTPVFAYGSPADDSSFRTPGPTIEARTGERVRIEWVNELVDGEGRFVPHLFAIDTTLHWASPSEAPLGDAYDGPVPLVAHLHGGHVPTESDGQPDAWFLPARGVPAGYTPRGPDYVSLREVPGAALYEYPNDQRAAALWYHDHAMGITRLNVYAGLAGLWIVRDAEEDALGLPSGTRREIPLVIQDRSFRRDGTLFYPDRRSSFDDYGGPYRPDSEVPPRWSPEYFGNTILVNGRTWPVLEVEPALYRLRVLNGSNGRFLVLAFDRSGPPMIQIGSDGGLLSGAPAVREELVLAPAERADVLIDFARFAPGEEIVLLNRGPDAPFAGLSVEQGGADPTTTGRVMLFRVVPRSNAPTVAIPRALPSIEPLTTPLPPRDLTLHEMTHEPGAVLTHGALGTAARGPLRWHDEVTERPVLGTTEIWRVANLTEDAHPIHLHLVMFQVLDRTPFDAAAYGEAQRRYLAGEGPLPELESFFTGPPSGPEPGERGWKDTAIASSGEVLRIVARFDLAGRYVWHCHVLEHEDNEMMRPFEVVP
jgi:spore coat protein A